MPHLTLEALARLVDESPMPDEAIHVAECTTCRSALHELRWQTDALRRLPSIAARADAWPAIAERVQRDRRAAGRRRRIFGHLGRLAAAIVLVTTGAGIHAWVVASRDALARDPIPGAEFLLSGRRPLSLDEAVSRVRAAELVYRRSLLDYSTIASPQPPRDLVARLATLDAIVLTTRTALQRAPADPVINTYHLAALAERETLLDQMR